MSQTKAMLAAEAAEKGITIPPKAKKADIEKLLSEYDKKVSEKIPTEQVKGEY